MSKIINALIKHFQAIHEKRPMILDRNWLIKILWERRDGKGWRTDIERDILFTAEEIEPDRTRWDISAEEYEAALAELRKQYPKMQ